MLTPIIEKIKIIGIKKMVKANKIIKKIKIIIIIIIIKTLYLLIIKKEI